VVIISRLVISIEVSEPIHKCNRKNRVYCRRITTEQTAKLLCILRSVYLHISMHRQVKYMYLAILIQPFLILLHTDKETNHVCSDFGILYLFTTLLLFSRLLDKIKLKTRVLTFEC